MDLSLVTILQGWMSGDNSHFKEKEMETERNREAHRKPSWNSTLDGRCWETWEPELDHSQKMPSEKLGLLF